MQEPPKVVDLMEALRRSLDSVSTEKKKPAKADKSIQAPKAATDQRRQGVAKKRESCGGKRSRTQVRRCRTTQPGDQIRQHLADAVGSRSQSGGVSHTKARIAITHRSYGTVARSSRQKNARQKTPVTDSTRPAAAGR